MTQADPLTIDLDDSDDARAGYDWAHLDLSRLKRPNSIRRLIGIVIALVVVFWPARSALVAGRLVGIGLVGYSVVTLWSVRKARPVPWLAVVLSVGALGLGAFGYVDFGVVAGVVVAAAVHDRLPMVGSVGLVGLLCSFYLLGGWVAVVLG